MGRRVLVIGLIVAALAAVIPADPAEPVATAPLRWKSRIIRIALSSSLNSPNPNIKTGTDVKEVIRRSLAAWENISSIKFVETVSEKQTVSAPGPAGDGVSLITIAQTPENLGLFQNDWQTASARTRVFYNGRREITEADIVLNPYAQFSDDGTFGTFDLQSTLTHEIGHLLGLDHSFVLGSVMYQSLGKNGLFGLQSRRFGVSREDIASLSALYGANNESCCGRIAGRITASRKPLADVQIWAEEAGTGLISGTAVSARNGAYLIDGLPEGEFRIFAQADGRAAAEVGEASVDKGKTVTANAAMGTSSADLDVRYLGINSQIAEGSLQVAPGHIYPVYLGGAWLRSSKIVVGTDSPFVTVDPDSIKAVDFRDDISVVTAEFTIASNAPVGEVSVYVESIGVKRYLSGAISIKDSADLWDDSSIK